MTLRLYGYPKDSSEEGPAALEEVTLVTSASTLRRLAEFFLWAADAMERSGPKFGHEHFGDFAREMRSSSDIIVVREGDDGE